MGEGSEDDLIMQQSDGAPQSHVSEITQVEMDAEEIDAFLKAPVTTEPSVVYLDPSGATADASPAENAQAVAPEQASPPANQVNQLPRQLAQADR